jgi:hypothetical protein
MQANYDLAQIRKRAHHQALCAEDRVIDEDVHRRRPSSVAAREHYGKRWKDERLWIIYSI